jgi:hypothetical protein
MANPCACCIHRQRLEIEGMIASGASNYAVAQAYGLSEPSVRRHKARHLGALVLSIAERAAERPATPVFDVADQMYRINQQLWKVIEWGKAKKNGTMVVQAAGQILRQIELVIRAGEVLADGTRAIQLREWQSAVRVIMETLKPYPELRSKLAERLQEMASADPDA